MKFKSYYLDQAAFSCAIALFHIFNHYNPGALQPYIDELEKHKKSRTSILNRICKFALNIQEVRAKDMELKIKKVARIHQLQNKQ